MGKTIRIIIYVAIMLLIFIWLTKFANGCNTRQHVDPIVLDENGIAQEQQEEDLFEGEEELSSEDSDELFESDEEPIDYSALDEAIEKSFDKTSDDSEFQSEEVTKEYPQETQTYNYTSSESNTGNYIIIAGSYLVEDNANNMVGKLDRMGYDAEKLVFDYSEYHSVIAGRYEDYSVAIDAANQLKNKGIDCYVHKRKF